MINTGLYITALTVLTMLALPFFVIVCAALYTRRQTVRMLKERRLAEKRISEYNKKFQDDYSPFD